MQFFKRNGASLLILLIAAGFGGYYFLYIYKGPCEAPITYRLGSIDPRFGVSTTTFEKDIEEASAIWNSAIDRQLFEYDPNGSLVMNLVYDIRQEATQQESKLAAINGEYGAQADAVKEQYVALEEEYRSLEKEYRDQVHSLQSAWDAYNSNVAYWNSRGGAPRKEYNALSAERDKLVAEQNSLEAKRQELNQLAAQINGLISQYNELVKKINANVDTINNDGIAGTQFEQGIYISDGAGTRINVYQFDDQTYFIRVLTHELGHALGLGHNNNPESIMNPLNQSESLTLTPEDLEALKTACSIEG